MRCGALRLSCVRLSTPQRSRDMHTHAPACSTSSSPPAVSTCTTGRHVYCTSRCLGQCGALYSATSSACVKGAGRGVGGPRRCSVWRDCRGCVSARRQRAEHSPLHKGMDLVRRYVDDGAGDGAPDVSRPTRLAPAAWPPPPSARALGRATAVRARPAAQNDTRTSAPPSRALTGVGAEPAQNTIALGGCRRRIRTHIHTHTHTAKSLYSGEHRRGGAPT